MWSACLHPKRVRALICEVQRGQYPRRVHSNPSCSSMTSVRVSSNVLQLCRSTIRPALSAQFWHCHTDAIVASACADASQPLRILELGAAQPRKRGPPLLESAVRRQVEGRYMPLDVSADALELACRNIEDSFPEVCIDPVVVNYITCPSQLEEFGGTTLALYLGSSRPCCHLCQFSFSTYSFVEGPRGSLSPDRHAPACHINLSGRDVLLLGSPAASP